MKSKSRDVNLLKVLGDKMGKKGIICAWGERIGCGVKASESRVGKGKGKGKGKRD